MDAKKKELTFYIDDDLHARFKIALEYDGLKQSIFIRNILAGYLANNPHIRNYIDEFMADKLPQKTKINRQKDKKQELEIIKKHMLSGEEIDDIFDLIESESEEND